MACCGKGTHPRPGRERRTASAPRRTATKTINGVSGATQVNQIKELESDPQPTPTTVAASRKAFTLPKP